MVDMIFYGTFWVIAGKWYGKLDSKKTGFTWEAFCGKFMGNLLVDMGTSVDNLWENCVEMVIYGKCKDNLCDIYIYIYTYMGMSENGVYPQLWPLVGIMISKTIGCRGTLFSDTPIWLEMWDIYGPVWDLPGQFMGKTVVDVGHIYGDDLSDNRNGNWWS